MASPRTKKFWALYFGSIVLLFFFMTLTAYSYHRQEANSNANPAFAVTSPGSAYNADQLKNQSGLLNIDLRYFAFDPEKGLKSEIAFTPTKNISASNGEPTVPICVNFQDKELEFPTKELMSPFKLAVTFLGDSNSYPFDVYTGQLILHAHTGTNESCEDPLAINPTIIGNTQGFVISAQVFPGINDDDSLDYSSARVEFVARRTRVHQVFSTFIFIVMWALTLMLSYITAWTWKGGQRVQFGIISMNSALLYALPRVRDSQPGIPKMGIAQDTIGYCWNVLIIAVSLFSLMINHILRKERKSQYRKSRDDGTALLQVLDVYLDDIPPPAYEEPESETIVV